MSTATASLVMTFVVLLISALAATYVKTRNRGESLGIMFTFLGGLDLIVVNVFELNIYAKAGIFGPEDNVFFCLLVCTGVFMYLLGRFVLAEK